MSFEKIYVVKAGEALPTAMPPGAGYLVDIPNGTTYREGANGTLVELAPYSGGTAIEVTAYATNLEGPVTTRKDDAGRVWFEGHLIWDGVGGGGITNSGASFVVNTAHKPAKDAYVYVRINALSGARNAIFLIEASSGSAIYQGDTALDLTTQILNDPAHFADFGTQNYQGT